jgi:hypothetical protein
MLGLVPGIHVFIFVSKQDVDGRVKPGHDGVGRSRIRGNRAKVVEPLDEPAPTA